MEHLKQETTSGAQLNLDALYQVCPQCFTESKEPKTGEIKHTVDFEKLRLLLGDNIAEGDERYDFTWVGKRAALQEAAKPIRKTLRPCPEESVDWNNTKNLYIEGDNLEVLKLLQNSYMGKVKMIYIDPPYNTGNDFVYQDDFQQTKKDFDLFSGDITEEGERLVKNTESNGRFHSDWCSMVYSRLMISRSLLSEDGVILINMDENEITNLQKITSEVFGESNDLGTIVWDKRNPKGDAKGISYQHEYILVYAKNAYNLTSSCKIQRPKKNAKAMIAKASQLFAKIGLDYSLEQANYDFAEWLCKQTDLSGGERAYNRIDDKGKLYRAVSMSWPNKKKAPDEYFIPLIHPITHKECPVPERGWRNPPQTMQALLKADMILFGEDESTQPTRKYLLEENMFENIPSLIYYGGSDTAMLTRLGIPFDTPKVVDIVKEHIQSLSNDDSIILDFFSGSATTAHAVMQLNAETRGSRKFIMVQWPEECEQGSEAYKAGYKNICEIGKERIRRAGKKILEDQKDKQGDLFSGEQKPLDVGFRVFKCADSNMKDVYYTPAEYSQELLLGLEDNIKEDRNDLDLLFGCMLDWGVTLDLPLRTEKVDGVTIHIVNEGDLVACFDQSIPETAIDRIASLLPMRVVLRDNCFKEAKEKMNFFEIFKQRTGWSEDEVRKNVKVI